MQTSPCVVVVVASGDLPLCGGQVRCCLPPSSRPTPTPKEQPSWHLEGNEKHAEKVLLCARKKWDFLYKNIWNGLRLALQGVGRGTQAHIRYGGRVGWQLYLGRVWVCASASACASACACASQIARSVGCHLIISRPSQRRRQSDRLDDDHALPSRISWFPCDCCRSSSLCCCHYGATASPVRCKPRKSVGIKTGSAQNCVIATDTDISWCCCCCRAWWCLRFLMMLLCCCCSLCCPWWSAWSRSVRGAALSLLEPHVLVSFRFSLIAYIFALFGFRFLPWFQFFQIFWIKKCILELEKI